MKLKFFHDVRIVYSPKTKEYYSGGFHYSIWERYLRIFNELDVHTRIDYKTDISDGYKRSSGSNVNMMPITSYKNIKSLFKLTRINKEINEVLNHNDGYLLRLPSVIGFLTGVKLIFKRKKYFVEVVGSGFDSFYYKGGIIAKLISLPAYYLQRKITKNASVVSYITESYLQDKYPTDGVSFNGVANVNYNFNDKSEINPKKINEVLSKKATEHYKIGLIGSLNVNYKGHLTALKSLKVLRENQLDVTLYFVGQGDIKKYNDFIKKHDLENNVVHLGILSAGDEIETFLQDMDIYIQPSKTEGHGRALVEAVYNGAISFGSNVGGIPDTLLNEYLFNPKDYKSLAQLISHAIHDKNFAKTNIVSNFNNIKKYQTDVIESHRTESLRKYKNILEETE